MADPAPPSEPKPQPNQTERRYVQRATQAFVQWSPLGGSGGLFVHFLLKQEWTQSLLMFPVLIVTTVWARYTEGFLNRLGEVASDRGKRDVDDLLTGLKTLDQALKWQLANPENQYLKCQIGECLYNETEGYRQPDDIRIPLLEEVFVPLELSSSFSVRPGEVIPNQLGSRSSALTKLLEKQLHQGSLQIWDVLSAAKKDPTYQQIAILAWGGFGKTTLLRHLTYSYAKGRQPRKAPKLVPVLLYLRKWRDELAKPDSPTLLKLITDHHIPALPGGKKLKLPPNWAEQLLDRGDALVMLDGFDEVAEDQRASVSHWISQQMQDYPKSIFILTSRPGGYKDFSGATRPKTTIYVKPFNPTQWQAFIHKWYLCQEQRQRSQSQQHLAAVQEIAQQEADKLIQQIQERDELAALATNPLLLNMITTFHRFYPGHELPKRRTELYQEICQLQLGGRPLAKRISLILSAEESQQVLQRLALMMVLLVLPRLKRNDALPLVERILEGLNWSIEAEKWFDQIVKVSELLVEREPGEYEFAHLSFQNYLAARGIADLKQEKKLIENYDKASWKEVTILYATQFNPTQLIQQLLNLNDPQANELAYQCWQESPRKVDPEVAQQLQSLQPQLQSVRYHKLEILLKNQQWKEADYETYRLMITTVGKEAGQWFEPEELLNFPCEDLRVIDGLWVKYSKGHFGFSVQKKIYVECGGKLDGSYDQEVWSKFGDRVGWRKDGTWPSYNDLNPSFSSFQGFFPCSVFLFLWVWVGGHRFSSLAQRLVDCSTSQS